jgi:hypothetical protein
MYRCFLVVILSRIFASLPESHAAGALAEKNEVSGRVWIHWQPLLRQRRQRGLA